MKAGLAIAVGLLGMLGPAAAAGYLADVPDLPLMEGFAEQADGRLLFDKPEGRIVAVRAEGRPTPAEVRAFYGEALPALGWRPGTAGAWLREGERLTITSERRGGITEIRFSLGPETR